nr:ABC-three component system protein [Mycoplasmopsis canis]WQQ12570.1 ABC-three component system protein [Mycoplasmopsis canis]
MEEKIEQIIRNFSMLDNIIKIKNENEFYDINKHLENIFRDILNRIFDWELKNINEEKKNSPSFDLVDDENKILIQVTSQNDICKVKKSLDSKVLMKYKNYDFKFLFLTYTKNNIGLKSKIENKYVNFNIKEDLWFFSDIVSFIKNLEILKRHEVEEYVLKVLEKEIFLLKESKKKTILSQIILKLIKNKEQITFHSHDIKEYKINEKINFNGINKNKWKIKEYSNDFAIVEQIYSSFENTQPQSRRTVWNQLKNFYYDTEGKNMSGDEKYQFIFGQTKTIVKDIINDEFDDIVDMCIDMILVHAFIQCKIFEKPKGDE